MILHHETVNTYLNIYMYSIIKVGKMGCLLFQKHLDIQIAHVALLEDISTLFSKNQLSALS